MKHLRITRIFTTFLLFFALSFSTIASAAGDLTCRVVPELMKAYLTYHVYHKNLTDELQAKTTDAYVKIIDPSKLMLLDSDVVKIRAILGKMFNSMAKGDCSALNEVQKLSLSRAEELETFVKGFVGKDYKLDTTVEFVFDSDKREYQKSMKDLEELVKKHIHFQVSNLVTDNGKLDEAKKSLIHRYELITKRLKEKSQEDLLTNFVDAFSFALDPHSSYFSADRLEDFKIEMNLSLEGIGASLSSQDGYTVIEEVIPGGAADRSKLLEPKDKIIAVRQDNAQPPVNVIDMELRDVVKLIRGKRGTKVNLTVLRQGEKTQRLEIAIVRDKIDLKDQAAKHTVETFKVGGKSYRYAVIDLPSFYGDTEKGLRSSYEDMKKILVQIKKEKVDGVVLNLSRNGGGLLEDAVRISGLFIKEGPVVATQNMRRGVEILADEDDSISYSGPLVVLTSRLSASASEILAGALRDYHRAVIVGGDRTFGKGSVQAVIPIPRGNLGAIKVTTGMFFIPGGQSTQFLGVAGDVVLPSTLQNDNIGEKSLPNALPPQKIPTFAGTNANFEITNSNYWAPVTPEEIKVLAKNSSTRVDASAKFKEIRHDMDDLEKNRGVIRLADFMKKSEEEKKKEKADKAASAKSKRKEKRDESDKPYLQESMSILSDLISMRHQIPASSTTVAPAKKK